MYFVLSGDVKDVTKTLRALGAMNKGKTVCELMDMLAAMTDEQKQRYIRVTTAVYEQLGGTRETEDERYRRLCGA